MNLTFSVWDVLFSSRSFRFFEATNCRLIDVGPVLLFLFLVLLSEFKWMKYRNELRGVERNEVRLVPGPLALPLIGTRWLYYFRYKINKVHEGYRDMFERYGDIVKEESLGNIPVISLKSKDDIAKVLKYPSKYPVRPPTEVTAYYRANRPDRYTSLGITNEQMEVWHQLRTSLTPELTSGKTLSKFFPELTKIADDFITLVLQSQDSSGVVANFEELANRLGLESTCTLVLGERFGFLDKVVGPTAQKLSNAVKDQFCASRDTFYGLPIWKFMATSAYKQFVTSEDTIYELISEMVDGAEKAEVNTIDDEGTRGVFMSILQAEGLDLRDKKAGIIDFIAGGIKTIGNTLVFLLYLMAKNKESQQRLFEEISHLAPQGTPLNSRILANAHYLKACILESFRILPTAPCVARILESDLKLGGFLLKSGTVVLCHTWLACLDESNFPNAKSFMPERWLTSGGTSAAMNSNPFLIVPFGVGRRTCPGKRFVEQELQVVLAQIIRHLEIDFNGELELDFEFLLAPRTPVNFIVRTRDQ